MAKVVYVSISDTLLMSGPRHNEYDLWEHAHKGPQMTDESEHGAREVLERLARIATAYASIEGSSSMEVAAGMVSYLAAHLQLVPDFMRGMESPNGRLGNP